MKRQAYPTDSLKTVIYLTSIVEDPVSGIGFGKEMNNEFGLIDISNIYPRYQDSTAQPTISDVGIWWNICFCQSKLNSFSHAGLFFRPYH